VIDAAHGAAYRVAPEVLWELGAEVIPIGVSPDGTNINQGCGSTDTALAARTVVEQGADLGICLDGDADRVMIIDEKGQVADGDQIMALLAMRFAQEGRLTGRTLVATVMSNLGLERYLAANAIAMHRTKVGDRYVVEEMRAKGYNLGGEQSGHIVMTDHATTGDGLMAGLQFLAEMVRREKPASALTHSFDWVPQKLVNVAFAHGARPLERPEVQAAIAEAEAQLAGRGRLLIRASGTEPKIRVMAEHEDEALLDEVVGEVARAVERAAA
jgi:phosphoglucosamine mutase